MDTTSHSSPDSLPIQGFREGILDAVHGNQVTIITAETGAGKSTQVPQFLAQAGYTAVVTQPRILAARNLCARVREEWARRTGEDGVPKVGYRTAPERDDDERNVITYCTDGLQLVRELTGAGVQRQQVLVLDEVHEWNENVEVLVAWAKQRCSQDPHFKLVLMSATIHAEDLAAYFETSAVIHVTGRSFPVSRRHGGDVVKEIVNVMTGEPHNVLVFLPGKAEIEQIKDSLRGRIPRDVPVLALHGQLDAAAQQQAFTHYQQGKIVLSTNVAQTSITINDIDSVIDTGLERRAEVRNGVEGLFIAPISQADCLQRAGRAGRTKAGSYVLASLDRLPCPALEDRPEYGIPEIMRTLIDRVVLRLAAIGIDIESLQFYHAPGRATVKLAKRTLLALGALTPSGAITETGRKMERFPVASTYARMLVESRAFSQSVQTTLAGIIAIQEVGGIIKGGARYTGWRQFTRQTQSDLIAHYEVYRAVQPLELQAVSELGVIGKNVTKAGEVLNRLMHELGLSAGQLATVAPLDVSPLLRCIVAGQLHQIWALDAAGKAAHIQTKRQRELSGSSVVKRPGLVVGTPFDLELATAKGLETLHLLNDVSVADPGVIADLAPGTFVVKGGKKAYDPYLGAVAQATSVTVNHKTYKAASEPVLENTSGNRRQFVELYGKWLQTRLDAERKVFAMYHSHSPQDIPDYLVRGRIEDLAPGAVSLADVAPERREALENLGKLETWLGSTYHIEPRLTEGQALKRQKKRRVPHAGMVKRGKRGR